jgi:hypothetical protein
MDDEENLHINIFEDASKLKVKKSPLFLADPIAQS